MTTTSDELNQLLQRSALLDTALTRFVPNSFEGVSDRIASSRIMCAVGFEHAESVKILIANDNFTSAISLLRLQYEALVRAVWLQYAASDKVTQRLMGEFTHEKAKQADRLSMMTQMLQELEGKAPTNIMNLLLQFKEHSWKPLSSYVHGGIHVLNRHSKGYPPVLIHQTVRASNSVSLILAMHLAQISGERRQIVQTSVLQVTFADCLLESHAQTVAKHLIIKPVKRTTEQ